MNLIEEIEEFLKQTANSREMKRALAVKMQLTGKSYRDIQAILNVSQGFISKWRNKVIFEGVNSLKITPQRRNNKLTYINRQEVVQWLRTQGEWDLKKLKNHLETKYQVVFHSPQSYHGLFKEAKIKFPVKKVKAIRKTRSTIQYEK